MVFFYYDFFKNNSINMKQENKSLVLETEEQEICT